nr:MAG: RNA-dependent RNA polymerase [Solemoviridae sp.]
MNRTIEFRKQYRGPGEGETEKILHQSERVYAKVRWRIDDDFFTYDHFERTLGYLQGTSSPGYPYLKNGTTITDYFGTCDRYRWDEGRKRELWSDVKNIFDREVLFRVFIKPEPHKEQKRKEKRWRLIFSSPLHFTVLGHMLFGPMRELELDSWLDIPSSYGQSIMHGKWKLTRAMITERNLRVSVDKSAWDINAPGWVFRTKLELRTRLCANMNQQWLQYAEYYYEQAYEHSKIIMEDGGVYQQQIDGIMKSGLATTIDDNSTAQYFIHALASNRSNTPIGEILCVGDDTIQQTDNQEYWEQIAIAGAKVKEVTKDTREFVGMRFEDHGLFPNYTAKHLYTLSHVALEDLPQTLTSYACLYTYHPTMSKLIREIAQAMGILLPSKQYIKYITDVSE